MINFSNKCSSEKTISFQINKIRAEVLQHKMEILKLAYFQSMINAHA